MGVVPWLETMLAESWGEYANVQAGTVSTPTLPRYGALDPFGNAARCLGKKLGVCVGPLLQYFPQVLVLHNCAFPCSHFPTKTCKVLGEGASTNWL